jgi:hypothetical protein
MSLIDCTTPSTTCERFHQYKSTPSPHDSWTSCSMPEYSPSVFSRINTVFTSSYGVLNPFMETQGRTLAKRLNVRRRVKLSETWPLPTGPSVRPAKICPMNIRQRTWRSKRSYTNKFMKAWEIEKKKTHPLMPPCSFELIGWLDPESQSCRLSTLGSR